MDPMLRPYVEIECKVCHVVDIIYIIDKPGIYTLDLHGWTSCLNSCCWNCPECKGKDPNINVTEVRLKVR